MPSYTWLNKMGVESSEGLKVRYVGRFELEVSWGRRRKRLHVEGVAHAHDVSIRDFEQWDNSSVPNDPAEQARILTAVQDALTFMDRNRP